MIKSEIIEVIVRRLAFDTEDYINIQKCWDKETEILCWIGEVFDDVAGLTQSKEFVAAIKRRAEKVVDAEERRSVKIDVSFAEDSL